MAVSLAALASRLYPYSSVPIPKFASLAAHSFANFGIKGTLAIYDSSTVFGFEVPTQTRGYNDRNFKSTALALLWQILSGMGFPNQFFNDSWVVGFWRADHGGHDAELER